MPSNKVNKRKTRIGLTPGSLVFTGNQKGEKVNIHYLKYSEENFEEKSLSNQEKLSFNKVDKNDVDWYDIRGLHDTKLIESIGEVFKIHPIIQEDIVDVNARPKFEEDENGLFIIIKALKFNSDTIKIESEHVALFLDEGLCISFQETSSDLFDQIRARIKERRGRIRNRKSDYLLFAILDLIIDEYLLIIDQFEDSVEQLESDLMNRNISEVRGKIHQLRKSLLKVRKSIGPIRESIGRVSKSENALIDRSTEIFLRDLYDHTIQITDMLDTQRDTLNGLQDLRISDMSLKMNQVMQVLTMVTAVFVPLSFLAGVYGMNFENMPELKSQNGYFVVLSVMAFIFLSSIAFFRYRKWF